MSQAVRERLTAPGPKRILALDGGGVRGIISLQFLARIEAELRRRTGRPDYRLCEYFDLVGGTSTGSIIAGAVAIGMEVSEILDLYLHAGKRVFSRRRFKFWQSLYDVKPLEEILEAHVGDIRLGDDAIRTGICIVTKRADTNSTWPLLNHPDGTYYEANRHVRLRDAVRASAAAPVFYRPAKVEFQEGREGVFVDGAVSMANNPALLLLFVATLRGFPFRWPLGEDEILLLSIGTGVWQQRTDALAMARESAFKWLAYLPGMLMADASAQAELLLQSFSRSPTPWPIDAEIGDLSDELWLGRALLHYVRYNVRLEADELGALQLGDLVGKLDALRGLAGSAVVDEHARIGAAAAARRFDPAHLPAAFDPASA